MSERKKSININLSLEQLENDFWKNEEEFPSGLVERCYQYRKIPLKDLAVEQLRILIGQNIGLQFLIPLAYEKLKENITAEGDTYPGDLLNAVVRSEKEFWKKNPLLHKAMTELINTDSHKLLQTVSNQEFHRNTAAFKNLLQ
jgi:hypothetical protein